MAIENDSISNRPPDETCLVGMEATFANIWRRFSGEVKATGGASDFDLPDDCPGFTLTLVARLPRPISFFLHAHLGWDWNG